jgi:hypothetical protein
MDELQAQIQTASMLISLGLTTVEKIRELFSSQGKDEETLAGIMLEVDRRLARRS